LSADDKVKFEFIKEDIENQTKKLFEEVVGLQGQFEG
jgi:hypothetical protein